MSQEGITSEGKNKDSEIVIQIKKAEEFSANQELTNTTTTATTTPLNYQTHPQAKEYFNYYHLGIRQISIERNTRLLKEEKIDLEEYFNYYHLGIRQISIERNTRLLKEEKIDLEIKKA
ncbi:hypothetical protein Glove_151g51 [Diversispora epigaea]|uniref:Uncharacterized protein n=1 Tax=Diversispora epigaea TaxID=1348612 RepID=A0A397J2M2_9GLOM|nr:hypothetical protein Glove_151g51 [Diversispora epigaea]